MVSSLMKAFAVLLAISTLVSCGGTVEDVDYAGNENPRQKLDLHLPGGESDKPRPVIVAMHGGGWAFGDKGTSGFLEPKTDWFNDQGFIVASVNYRLSPSVTHPAHIQDVAAAIAWVQKHIAGHGGDPKRIYLLGHSAGAHLAALAGVDRARLEAAGADPDGIRGVILLDGAAYDVPRQIDSTRRPAMERMYLTAFTSDAKTQRDASPALKVARFDVAPPPFLILHVATRPSSTDQARRLARALRASGGTATVTPVDGKNHGTINRDLGKAGDPTTEAVAAFLGIE